jgi:arginine/lysine/ornithine decarboxylase
MIAFHEAPEELLVREPDCWVLHPQDEWHGFATLEDGYCMLDPIKVSLLTPGLSKTGALEAWGIPASVLTSYLDQQGIVVEKTTNFTVLILFSLGITKGKWGTLVNAMLDFKRDYDANAPLSQVLPQLVEAHPSYRRMGLKDLAQAMFEALRTLRGPALLAEAFSSLPTAVFSPIETYERLVRGGVEQLTLEEMAGRIVATGIVPYPPGIPLMMPGESAGAADGPVLWYLKALEEFDRQFPGFTQETHGIEVTDGVYRAYCLKK